MGRILPFLVVAVTFFLGAAVWAKAGAAIEPAKRNVSDKSAVLIVCYVNCYFIMFIFYLRPCKDNKKDDTMRDRNVKMWMNFSFLDKNMSDNEMDKKNGGYIKSGCGIGEKCEEIYISSILDFVVPVFFITFAHETS